MSTKLINNKYEIIQELDVTPFTHIYKARIANSSHSQSTDPNSTNASTNEESKSNESHNKATGEDSFVVLKKLKNYKVRTCWHVASC